MIAIVGGVIVLILIIVAVVMMGGGDSSAPAPGPMTPEEEYNPDTAAQEVPQPPVGEEDAPALEEEPEVVEKEVPQDAPSVDDPTAIDGCVGWFTGDSFNEDEQVWKDKSGKGNDCTEILGTIFKTDDSNGNMFIQGTKEDGLKFPKECMTRNKKHTFISVARFTSFDSTEGNQRIFDGIDANYLVGFHAYGPCHGIVGTGHRAGNGWVGHWECAVHHKNADGTPSWVLHTDQKSKMWANGARKTGKTNLGEQRTSQMTINWGMGRGWGQASNWSVGECIFYDRELSADEIEKVELMLHKKWKIPRRVQSGVWVHNNTWSRYHKDDGWNNQDAIKTLGRFGVDCGDKGLNDNSRFVLHHYWNADQNKWLPNGNWGVDGGCQVNTASGPGAKKKTQWTSTEERDSWQTRLSKALDIDCGRNGLQNWEFELNPDGSQFRVQYQCSADRLATQACMKRFNVAQGDGREDMTMPDSTHGIQAACLSGTVTNKLKWTQVDGKWGYESTCCPVEDK
jgi:hypothetical protein